MEFTRIERMCVATATLIGLGSAAAFLGLRHDLVATWYAWQLVISTTIFLGGFLLWYRAAPTAAGPASRDDSRALQLAKSRRDFRRRYRGRRYSLLGIAVALLGGAIVARRFASLELADLSALLVGVGALVLTTWVTLSFPGQDRVEPTYNAPRITRLDREDPFAKEQVEFLKIEYTKAADRYENIYKAIWQNFSYMSVVSAGILTFGQRSLSIPVLAFLAVTPLFFWYVATFLPMDHYGQEVRNTLRRVESYINTSVDKPLLGHFVDFATIRYHWRVRDPVRAFGTTLAFLWIASLSFAAGHLIRSEFLTPGRVQLRAAVAAQIRSLQRVHGETDSLMLQQLRQLEVLLREQSSSDTAVTPTTRASQVPSAGPPLRDDSRQSDSAPRAQATPAPASPPRR